MPFPSWCHVRKLGSRSPERGRRRAKRQSIGSAGPGFEALEGRILLDTVRRVNPAGGAWETPRRWGLLPGRLQQWRRYAGRCGADSSPGSAPRGRAPNRRILAFPEVRYCQRITATCCPRGLSQAGERGGV
jgi:hypothetical protein